MPVISSVNKLSYYFAASLVGWNLISLVNMLLFFAIQFATPTVGKIFPLHALLHTLDSCSG